MKKEFPLLLAGLYTKNNPPFRLSHGFLTAFSYRLPDFGFNKKVHDTFSYMYKRHHYTWIWKVHPRKKIAKIACFNKVMQLHCIYKPSWCVHVNVQLQGEISVVGYKPTGLVLPHHVDMLTHYLDVKIHTVPSQLSTCNFTSSWLVKSS